MSMRVVVRGWVGRRCGCCLCRDAMRPDETTQSQSSRMRHVTSHRGSGAHGPDGDPYLSTKRQCQTQRSLNAGGSPTSGVEVVLQFHPVVGFLTLNPCLSAFLGRPPRSHPVHARRPCPTFYIRPTIDTVRSTLFVILPTVWRLGIVVSMSNDGSCDWGHAYSPSSTSQHGNAPLEERTIAITPRAISTGAFHGAQQAGSTWLGQSEPFPHVRVPEMSTHAQYLQ